MSSARLAEVAFPSAIQLSQFAPVSDPVLDQLERLIRTDPARRGLIASEPEFGPLLSGHFHRAANELATAASSVAIATGFYIPGANPPAAETDGPPGAVLLA